MALPTVADRYSAQRPRDKSLYTDFLVDFNKHPDSNQFMVLKDEASVTRSIKNLLSTNRYERLFQPEIGSTLQAMLFEPVDASSTTAIKNRITETIENYEPRAKLIDVIVTPYADENAYVVTIIFYVTTITNQVTVNIPLMRVR